MSQLQPARLRDGTRVALRPVRSADEPALRSFLEGLCADARQLRFFTGGVNIAKAARRPPLRAPDTMACLADDEAGLLVGHAVLFPLERGRAEVAVEVADQLHGPGWEP